MIEVALRIFFSLVVLLLMVGLARHGPAARWPGAAAGALSVLARQPLTRGASVAVVRVGERALVLGVTDQNVTLLAEAEPAAIEAAAHPRHPRGARATPARRAHAALRLVRVGAVPVHLAAGRGGAPQGSIVPTPWARLVVGDSGGRPGPGMGGAGRVRGGRPRRHPRPAPTAPTGDVSDIDVGGGQAQPVDRDPDRADGPVGGARDPAAVHGVHQGVRGAVDHPQRLGLTTVPPNQVIAGLALFLSLFIIGPDSRR